MSNIINEMAEMAAKMEAQEAAQNENTETATAAPEAAMAEPQDRPTEAAPAKGKKAKKDEARQKVRSDFEEAQIRAAELKREAEAKQRELDKCLEVLKNKKRLADNRAKFIETLAQLDEA